MAFCRHSDGGISSADTDGRWEYERDTGDGRRGHGHRRRTVRVSSEGGLFQVALITCNVFERDSHPYFGLCHVSVAWVKGGRLREHHLSRPNVSSKACRVNDNDVRGAPSDYSLILNLFVNRIGYRAVSA